MKPDRYFNDETGEVKVGKIIFYVFGVVILLGILFGGGSYIWRWATQPARTAEEIREQTFSGENVIYQYEQFFDRLEEIRANHKKIRNAEQRFETFKTGLPTEPGKWTYNQRQEYERENVVVTGLKNTIEDKMAIYNAHASKINRNIFMDDNLPHRVSLNKDGALVDDMGEIIQK